MSERIAIQHSGSTWFTTGTLDDVCERLNAGEKIVVWGYSPNGDRWEEEIVFYGPPDYVVTDKA